MAICANDFEISELGINSPVDVAGGGECISRLPRMLIVVSLELDGATSVALLDVTGCSLSSPLRSIKSMRGFF